MNLRLSVSRRMRRTRADARAPYQATSIRVVGARTGLTRMFGLALDLPGCPEIDLSAGPERSPDTYRSGGVTY